MGTRASAGCHHEPVAGRVSSPRFIGRAAQLARLDAAYEAAADEHASTVLVGGEAGVGKTRLVDEFTNRVRAEGGIAIVGGCLEMVDRALPFGPIIEALRQLHRTLDDTTLASVLGPTRSELSRLLPEFASFANPPTDDTDAPSARLFEHLLAALERLGDRAPTVLVIEDLHWADRSTRQLLAFLARNLRVGRVLVVGTYRSDDLNRRHPLRTVLAELERSGVERIDVERFTVAELRAQLAAILGGEPADDLVSEIHSRSDGNAFFAEELLAAAGDGTYVLSPTLRDVLLARVDGLPDTAQHVLRLAAVIGRRVDHRLLVALADQPEPLLMEGLREAVAHQVLLTDPDNLTYQFRHALVQEAVYDDLLPGERVQLHARFAHLLTDEPEVFHGSPGALANELACHWYAAHDQRRALQAAFDAAHVADHMYAYPEALAHAERVLELWAQVPDAAALTGLAEVGVMRYAARVAELAGDVERALALVRQAQLLVDPDVDPVTAGMLREREARCSWMLGHSAEDLLPLNHESVRLVPAEPPSEERAHVLAALGQQLMLAGRNHDAIEWCEQAIVVAQQVGARAVEGHARNTLGTSLSHLGEVESGLAQLHDSREIAHETRSWGDLARTAVNEGGALQGAGRHEEAVVVSLAGADEARRHGLDRSIGSFLRLNAAGSMWRLGRWDEMEEQLREVEAIGPVGVDVRRSCEEWAALHIGRGRFDEATREIASGKAISTGRDSLDARIGLAGPEAQLYLWQGEPERVHAVVFDTVGALARRVVDDVQVIGFHDWGEALYMDGIAALADIAERARLRDDERAERDAIENAQTLRELMDKAQARFSDMASFPYDPPVLRRQADAELARALARPDPEAWRALAEDWSRTQRRPNAAYARWREAQAHLQAGTGATEAAEPLRAAHAIASEVGFIPLLAAIEDLARRARIEIGERREASASPLERAGLTNREREVLDLVAAGSTNRQIADVLFISTKTASVHVSNILAKLGVANRGEAAARARELGIEQVAAQ
ncbi:MAG: hypothetical protein JWL83_2209 [Actinomycetia bacterium]|nr:hypothetical protein [Actinomycetes bacterium]